MCGIEYGTSSRGKIVIFRFGNVRPFSRWRSRNILNSAIDGLKLGYVGLTINETLCQITSTVAT